MKYRDTGFRSFYHAYIAVPVTDDLRKTIRQFPGAEEAGYVLTYGYIDPVAGMTLEVGATQPHCRIASGTGSAPALDVQADITAEHDLDADWHTLFGNWHAAVAFLACQDAAIAHVPRNGKLVFGEIDLPVDVDQVQALTASRADCGLLGQLPPMSKPFAFLVPEVPFKALSERLL